MCVKVIANQRWDVFETQCIYAQNAFHFRVYQLTSLKYVKLKLQTTVLAKLLIHSNRTMQCRFQTFIHFYGSAPQ